MYAYFLFCCLKFKNKREKKKKQRLLSALIYAFWNTQGHYHRIFPHSLTQAHTCFSREGILWAPPEQGCFPQAPLKQQEAKGPRALPSPCKDDQFALVTTNLLASLGFRRVLCLGTVAGLRLLRSYLFWLPTKETVGDWQAGPHSVGVYFCKGDFVCLLELQPSSFSLQIPDTWRASF